MDLITRIENIIEEPLAARGYDIVRIQMLGKVQSTLQIMIERQDAVPITVDHCAEVSRMVSVLLDLQDPIDARYTLEVSSGGLERPLVKPKDFQKYQGHQVVVNTFNPIEGRKRFLGLLESANDSEIKLDLIQVNEGQSSQITIPIVDIRAAKLYVDFEEL